MAARPEQVIEELAQFNAGDIEGVLSLYEVGATFLPTPGTTPGARPSGDLALG